MKRILICIAAMFAAAAVQAGPVDFQWIDKTPTYAIGQSFGVPFAKGEMNDYGTFTLTDASGKVIPAQSWPMAHWNDGSVKWMGFYATISPDNCNGLTLNAVAADKKTVKKLSKQKPVFNPGIVKADNANEIVVDNGLYEITFPKSGSSIISKIVMGGNDIVTDGKLVLKTEDRSKAADDIISYVNFESNITSAEVEHTGDVAAVIKIQGTHKALKGSREWLPFTVRFYIYAGATPMKMVHSFVFDGEQSEDFIKGLGVEFSLPFRESILNRHVAFAGDNDGLWEEAALPLIGGVRMPSARPAGQGMPGFGAPGQGRPAAAPGQGAPGQPGAAPQMRQLSQEEMQAMMREMMRQPDIATLQFKGEKVPNIEEFPETTQRTILEWAKYNDYKLVQANADGFTIQKRTDDRSTWFGTAAGKRARGFALAGDFSGGIGVSLKNFWQSFPAEFDVTGMRTDKGKITVWMWSPSSDAMDLRHYDTEGHGLGAAYEDYVEGYSTPYGIGHTSELMLFPYCERPSREALSDMANIGQDIVQLMVTPQNIHDAGAFGAWSLPAKNGNDTQKFLEEQIDNYVTFYQRAIETQHWYGFWNYGDFMHSYNTTRHTWNYDTGGRAWDNTELETDLWLWFGFIRSGRADFYRLATAMTRHTSEVDAYHIGPMAGLGTRHNVSHWGCGAKEARVGQAWWKRYYYYLFVDDRLGDLMHESLQANEAFLQFDPLIRAQTRDDFPTQQPTRLRWGPDWTCLVGNWFTEWERTGDKKYLDWINAGMNSLTNLPNGLFTGKGPYGYDPETHVLTYEGDPEWFVNSNHLANLQSSVEIFAEVLDEIDNKEFNKTYYEYAGWYGTPRNDEIRNLPENKKYENWWGNWNIPRLTALSAKRTGNEYLAKLAWKRLLDGVVDMNGNIVPRVRLNEVGGSDVLNPGYEDGRVGTNDCAQWNLEAIIMQDLIGEYIPDLKDVERSTTMVRAR